MTMFRSILLIVMALCAIPFAGAQTDDDEMPYMGLEMDYDAYSSIPAKPRLLTRDYTSLPARWSLKRYAPTARSQGQHGTCTSWATTYAARTIAEAVSKGWESRMVIDKEAFAPIFVYNQIKLDDDPDCKNGTYIHQALELLIEKGAPKFSDFNVLCANTIPAPIFEKAKQYTMDDYFTIFGPGDSHQTKVQMVKKSLSQNRPVVICMQVPKSFCMTRGSDVWNKTESVVDGGWHAMCVVGYDDEKYGGAFEILNSWGTGWGKDGYIWARYKDFTDHVTFAYEPYLAKKEVKPKPEPGPKPKPQPANKFSGSAYFQLSSGDRMTPKRNGDVYEMEQGYISGTRYRIYLSNNEPAWVYVLGSDATGDVSTVFPPDAKTSAALVYSSNDIALPNEKWFIEMDSNKGTDNICVLYSIKELPIDTIVSKIKSGTGTFRARVSAALGAMNVGTSEIQWKPSEISFSGRSDASVVPVFVDIRHL